MRTARAFGELDAGGVLCGFKECGERDVVVVEKACRGPCGGERSGGSRQSREARDRSVDDMAVFFHELMVAELVPLIQIAIKITMLPQIPGS